MTRQSTKEKNVNKTLGKKDNPLSLAKYFKERKKIMLTKHDPLITYFSEKIKKTVDIVQDKSMSFLETDKNYCKKIY